MDRCSNTVTLEINHTRFCVLYFRMNVMKCIRCSGVTGGGRGKSASPETSDRSISADLSGKEGNGVKKKETWISEGENVKWKDGRGKVTKWGEDPLFFFFFFQNDWNLFWFYQNGNFLLGKSISLRGKNQETWLYPLRKIFLLHPWYDGYLKSNCFQATQNGNAWVFFW